MTLPRISALFACFLLAALCGCGANGSRHRDEVEMPTQIEPDTFESPIMNDPPITVCETRRIQCPICEGSGRKWCAPCAGEGWVHNFNDLAFPGANGRSSCAHCSGSGRQFCHHCSGTGMLEVRR